MKIKKDFKKTQTFYIAKDTGTTTVEALLIKFSEIPDYFFFLHKEDNVLFENNWIVSELSTGMQVRKRLNKVTALADSRTTLIRNKEDLKSLFLKCKNTVLKDAGIKYPVNQF